MVSSSKSTGDRKAAIAGGDQQPGETEVFHFSRLLGDIFHEQLQQRQRQQQQQQQTAVSRFHRAM